MELSKCVGKRIKFLCKEKGLAISDLAKESSLDISHLEKLVKGSIKDPDLADIFDICDALAISVDYFFDDEIFKKKSVKK